MKKTLLALTVVSALNLTQPVYGQSFELPLWRSEVEARGYTLPKPFGLNLSYMALEQKAQVNQIDLDIPKLSDAIGFKADLANQTMSVTTLRGDVWLLPFLNLYALAGKTRGESQANVDVELFNRPLIKDLPFTINLDGNLFGGGFTLVGGLKQWFALVDASRTYTTLTVVDGSVATTVISPRIGYDFTQKGIPMRLWVGSMYQDVEQVLTGDLSKIIGSKFSGSYRVEQSLLSPWNGIAGLQYQFHPNVYGLVEVGFGQRKSAFATLDLRF